MHTIDVDVLLDDKACARPAVVVAALQRAGLREPRLLPALGVVRGRVEPSRVRALADIAGVQAVEQARRVHAADRPA
jgi:hypothetical protein